MTTKRKQTQSTSRAGINFVRALVEHQNSIFQEIELHNDLGNDAYLEFVMEENSTGCCVALQIKSGISYRSTSDRYFFQSDRDHFEYWASHTLPVFTIIFDPQTEKAVWVDITNYLIENPHIISEGPYTIYANREFSETTFPEFRNHCLNYRDQYSHKSNFSRALESFSDRENIELCFDGLHALFAYHRHKFTTWYYLIACIYNYREHPVLRQLVICLCHIPGHADIFWGKENSVNEAVRQKALQIMKERFDYRDAITLLSAIDDAGIDRGTIGQCIHSLINTMADPLGVMELIALDPKQDEYIRRSAILFAVSTAQDISVETALEFLKSIRLLIDINEFNELISLLEEDLRLYGYVSLY